MKKISIMIVDDETYAIKKLEEQLKSLSFIDEIYSYSNPLDALHDMKNLAIEVAILDIEMWGMHGIELAAKMKLILPTITVIFLTAYSEYALHAFKVRASGYLLKPVQTEDLEAELLHALQHLLPEQESRVYIQTFGNFEIFVDGHPLSFERIKSKELLAYLVSKKGAYVSGEELIGILYEDRPVNNSVKSQLRNRIASLTKSLREANVENLLLKKRGHLAINPDSCTCDYYEFLKGDVATINSFMGEFMSNYAWAEFITGYLEHHRD